MKNKPLNVLVFCSTALVLTFGAACPSAKHPGSELNCKLVKGSVVKAGALLDEAREMIREERRWEDALKRTRESLDTASTPRGYSILAVVAAELGDPETASWGYRCAVQLGPESKEVRALTQRLAQTQQSW